LPDDASAEALAKEEARYGERSRGDWIRTTSLRKQVFIWSLQNLMFSPLRFKEGRFPSLIFFPHHDCAGK
jgi:hypothetical protein